MSGDTALELLHLTSQDLFLTTGRHPNQRPQVLLAIPLFHLSPSLLFLKSLAYKGFETLEVQ